MKKGLTVAVLCLLTTLGMGQSCLFERTFNDTALNPVNYYLAQYAEVAALEIVNGEVAVFGSSTSCRHASALFYNCISDNFYRKQANGAGEYSWYTSSAIYNGRTYVAGTDLQLNDVGGDGENGFVEVFDNLGVQTVIIKDSSYENGFNSLAVNHGLVAVTSAVAGGSALILYDTLGTKKWDDTTVALRGVSFLGAYLCWVWGQSSIGLGYQWRFTHLHFNGSGCQLSNGRRFRRTAEYFG